MTRALLLNNTTSFFAFKEDNEVPDKDSCWLLNTCNCSTEAELFDSKMLRMLSYIPINSDDIDKLLFYVKNNKDIKYSEVI